MFIWEANAKSSGESSILQGGSSQCEDATTGITQFNSQWQVFLIYPLNLILLSSNLGIVLWAWESSFWCIQIGSSLLLCLFCLNVENCCYFVSIYMFFNNYTLFSFYKFLNYITFSFFLKISAGNMDISL